MPIFSPLPLRRLPLVDAWAWIARLPYVDPVAQVAPGAAIGRCLVKDVCTSHPLPAQDLTTMDGLAVVAEDILGASAYNPIGLDLVAGRPTGAGQAMAVVAGQRFPDGFDSVLPVEKIEARDGVIEAVDTIARSQGRARAGQSAETGQPLIMAGQRLTPRHELILTAAGISTVIVARRPEIAVLCHGAKDGGTGSLDAITRQLAAMGAEPRAFPRATTTLTELPPADLILVIGRSALGEDDVAAAEIAAAGGHLDHHGLALRPCETAGLGSLGATPLILLPGAPLASWVGLDLLVKPLIRRWLGLPAMDARSIVTCTLGRKIASPVGMADWVPVNIDDDDRAWPLPLPATLDATALARATGHVLVPASQEGHASGDSLSVHLFDC